MARLVPARGGAALRGKFKGLVWQTVSDEELIKPIDEEWLTEDWLDDETTPR